MKSNFHELSELSINVRKLILEVGLNCGAPAHLGGAFSIVDILSALYGKVLKYEYQNPESDRFILSKGHGFLALLSILHLKGLLTKEEILQFQTNGSEFIAHPIANPQKGIESSNGSLGQGLSFGIGIALSYKKKNKKGDIYVLLGDGECYEGSVWEAAISASELKLDNLFTIVDCNGYQNDGSIGNNMTYEKILDKWKAFGWNTIGCDGHNFDSILKAFKSKKNTLPTAIIAKTIKGKGIKFMENNNDWHHNRLTQKLYDEAIQDLI